MGIVRRQKTKKSALEVKLGRLRGRIDVKVVDSIFDEILKRIPGLKRVSCALDGDTTLCLRAGGETVASVQVDRAKSVLRMMCARLSVRCSEWANREVSPYGDHVEFEMPTGELSCKIDFENTPAVQGFEITA